MSNGYISLGSLIGQAISSGFQIGTQYFATKKALEIQKKYAGAFYLLAQQKAQAEQQAEQQLVDIQKEKLEKEYELEKDIAVRQIAMLEDWLMRYGEKMDVESIQKEEEEKKSRNIGFLALTGAGLYFLGR